MCTDSSSHAADPCIAVGLPACLLWPACRPAAAAAEQKPVKEKAAKGDKGKKPEGSKGPGKGAKQAQSAASPEEIRAVRLQKVGGR